MNFSYNLKRVSINNSICKHVFSIYSHYPDCVHHLNISIILVGSLHCSAMVNFPPRTVCCDLCSTVMVSGSSVGERGVGLRRATVTLIYTLVGNFWRNVDRTQHRWLTSHSSLFLRSTPWEPFIEILSIFVTILQYWQVYCCINKSNVSFGQKNVAVKIQHDLLNFESSLLL